MGMEYLFPIPSPYELVDYSMSNLTFNIAYSFDKEIKILRRKNLSTKKFSSNIDENIFLFFLLLFFKLNYLLRLKFFQK